MATAICMEMMSVPADDEEDVGGIKVGRRRVLLLFMCHVEMSVSASRGRCGSTGRSRL